MTTDPFAVQQRDGFYPAVDADLFNILLICSLTVGSEIESCVAILLFGKPRNIMVNTSICLGVKLNLFKWSWLLLIADSFSPGTNPDYCLAQKPPGE